jgi:hypothetical protein
MHPNSGLVYYLYRYYDPSLQRWINRDPIAEAGGVNLYRICFANTINRCDFFGLSDKPQSGGGKAKPTIFEKITSVIGSCAEAPAEAGQWAMSVITEVLDIKRPPSAASGGTSAAGGAVIEAGDAMLQAGPDVTQIGASQVERTKAGLSEEPDDFFDAVERWEEAKERACDLQQKQKQ